MMPANMTAGSPWANAKMPATMPAINKQRKSTPAMISANRIVATTTLNRYGPPAKSSPRLTSCPRAIFKKQRIKPIPSHMLNSQLISSSSSPTANPIAGSPKPIVMPARTIATPNDTPRLRIKKTTKTPTAIPSFDFKISQVRPNTSPTSIGVGTTAPGAAA